MVGWGWGLRRVCVGWGWRAVRWGWGRGGLTGRREVGVGAGVTAERRPAVGVGRDAAPLGGPGLA